jgi:hypothetical protein
MTETNITDMALSRIGEPEVGSATTSRRATVASLHYAQTVHELLRAHRWNFAIKRTVLEPVWITPTVIADSGSADEYRITSTSHGLATGQRVTLGASANYPGIQGTWRITVVSGNAFDLDESVFAGSGAVDTAYTPAGVTEWAYSMAAPADMLRALEDDRAESGTFTQWVLEAGRILTNSESLAFSYVRDETDAAVYGKDPLFVTVLVLRLAMKLTVALRGESRDTAGLARELEAVTAPLAKRVDANEGQSRERLFPRQSLFVAARSRGTGA